MYILSHSKRNIWWYLLKYLHLRLSGLLQKKTTNKNENLRNLCSPVASSLFRISLPLIWLSSSDHFISVQKQQSNRNETNVCVCVCSFLYLYGLFSFCFTTVFQHPCKVFILLERNRSSFQRQLILCFLIHCFAHFPSSFCVLLSLSLSILAFTMYSGS